MKKILSTLISEILKEQGIEAQVEITIPDNQANGDYTTNIAMKVAGQLKKPPMDIALSVTESIMSQVSGIRHDRKDHNIKQKHHPISQKSPLFPILQAIDRVEVAPPGFINVFLTEATLSSQLSQVLKDEEAYGTSTQDKKRIVVEFTDPNPFKEFHIGHLYSNAVGESLCRLFEATGQIVRRVNYQGDIGMHVAKAIWAIVRTSDLTNLEKKSLAERVKFLGHSYATGSTAYEENPDSKKEIITLNKLVFIAAQEMFAQKEGWEPVVDYKQGERIDEKELAIVRELYEKGRTWSLDYFETIYARLGTKFQGYYFESKVGEIGVKIVREHMRDGIFEPSQGAVVYRGEKHGFHTRVFINKLGLPTYETKELGLAPTKYKDWPYDQSLIVTANEINEYFKVLIAALTDVNPELGKKTKHLGHGIVRLPEGKMSSRTGNILTGEWLLDEAKRQILEYLSKTDRKYTKEDQELIGERAAVAAIKYSLLKVSLPSDISFDINTSISFDGDSGPYLQYTYARCKSVLRKASEQSGKIQGLALNSRLSLEDSKRNPEERAVARLILYFADIVAKAANDLSPSYLCTYLFQLAQAFNLFYAKHEILGNTQRLALTAATAQVLKNGLYLLGIEVLEHM